MSKSPFDSLRFGLALKLSFRILKCDSTRTFCHTERVRSRKTFWGCNPPSVSPGFVSLYVAYHRSLAATSPTIVCPTPFTITKRPPESSHQYGLGLCAG